MWVIFLVVLFYTGDATETWQRNSHYNIRHGQLAHLRAAPAVKRNPHPIPRKAKPKAITTTIKATTAITTKNLSITPKLNITTVNIASSTSSVPNTTKVEKKPAYVLRQLEVAGETKETEVTKQYLETVCYDQAILMRVYLTGSEELKFIKTLQRSNDIQLWGSGAYFMDFLVHRAKKDVVEEKLKDRKENYTCLLTSMDLLLKSQRFERSEPAHKAILAKFDFKLYVSLETINALFQLIKKKYPNETEIMSIGQSHEKREIMGLRVNKRKSNKAIILIGGIHGRDWASITSVLSVLGFLIKEDNEQKVQFFDGLDWYFIPVLNPDGYQHTRYYDRFWSKNRRKFDSCYGVDLNSNFGKHWDSNILMKHTENVCSDDYAGASAFSEPETSALRGFVEDLLKKQKVVGFIDVHSYGQSITYPWGGITQSTPDWFEHTTYARGMRQNIFSQTMARFTYAPSYDVPHPRPGLSIDWAYSIGIKHSYIIETRDTNQYGYLLPNNLIEPAGQDLVQAMKSLARRLSKD